PNVIIRYYEARPPDGDTIIPICAVARSAHGGLTKDPNSRTGVVILTLSRAALWIVDEFR
ncbi:MAG: serine/threonine protein kinase, partial [Cystobacter sp.]